MTATALAARLDPPDVFASLPQGAGTDLILGAFLTPELVFGTPGGVQRVLQLVEAEVEAFKPDMETAEGRQAIRTFAFRITRSKTLLDQMGKEVGEKHYKAWKAMTGIRSILTTRLDELHEKARAPLTEYEELEKARVQAHENALARVRALGSNFNSVPSVQDIDARVEELAELSTRTWEEYEARVADAMEEAQRDLSVLRKEAVKREVERAELEALRKANAILEQQKRDKEIADKAAAAAIEAEAAKLERAKHAAAAAEAKAAKAIADKKAAATMAALAKKNAAEKAERDKLAAVDAERERVAQEEQVKQAQQAKREADLRHVRKVNSAILEAMMEKADIKSGPATKLLAAINAGEIPYVKVTY